MRKDEDVGDGSAPRVETVHRALVLLKMLGERGALSVTEAAGAIGVYPSTAQRILATLVGDGFAVQGVRKRYEPGPELLRPGVSRGVPSVSARLYPHLERLFQRVRETVHLATLVGAEVDHVAGIEATQHAIRFGLRTGVRLPAHVTSSGKAMLAELPADEVDARYRVALTGRRGPTIEVDLEQLHADLDRTRRNGIGSNFEESERGVAAFAASIGVVDGAHAAFSIAMPVSRCARRDIPRFAADLLTTTREARADLSVAGAP